MKLHHMTNKEVTEITNKGNFKDVFFFGEEVHYLMEDLPFHYTIDASDLSFLNASKIEWMDDVEENEIVIDFAETFDISIEDAVEVLSNKAQIGDYSGDYSDESYTQIAQAKFAVSVGYDGAISEDEQGVVYMIPMFGREDLLNFVGKEA